MVIPFYSLFAILSIIILSLFYVHTIKITKTEEKSINSFRILIIWNIIFAIQDGIWGLCDAGIIRSHLAFFVSSTLFHISTVVSANMWIYYVLNVIEDAFRYRRLLKGLGHSLIGIQIILLITNLFTPTIFYISDNGKYVTSFLRPIAFYNQYFIYVIAALVSVLKLIKGDKEKKSQYKIILLFAASPVLSGYLQLKFPDAPFYTIGYLVGCTIIYSFVVSGEQILFLKKYISKQKEQYKNYYNQSQKELTENIEILYSMADVYYSMHLIDLEKNTIVQYSARDEIKEMINDFSNANEMMKRVLSETVDNSCKDAILEFTDLTTLPERMKNITILDSEFIGTRIGWFVAQFITIDKDSENKPTRVLFTTRSINEEKQKEQHLIYKSNTDEMTGFYNRRAYEEAINEYNLSGFDDDFVYVSIDINGLKIANDNLGHEAGDELIIGACQCMKECFEPYGRLYRIGGDEFVAIMNVDELQLELLKSKLETLTANWEGKEIDKLTLSCGYVYGEEAASLTLHEIVVLADKRMYEAKSMYYRKSGFDRRGQRDAHIALYSLYTKILKINITEDSYQIINIDDAEISKDEKLPEKISEWLTVFGTSGQVHPDDLDLYLKETNLSTMSEYFKKNKTSLNIFYRRKYKNNFKNVMMEIIPANDYEDTNQNLFLYVKNIDKYPVSE